jgi:glycosyltransferase involved in cell wall biosynthesis
MHTKLGVLDLAGKISRVKARKKKLRVTKKARLAVIGGRGYGSNYGGVENSINEIFSRIDKTQQYEIDIYGHGESNGLQIREVSSNITVINIPKLIGKFLGNAGVSVFATLYALTYRRSDVFVFFASGPCMMAFFTKIFVKPTIGCLRAIDSGRDKWGFIASLILRFGEYSALNYTNICTVNSLEMQRIFSDSGYKTKFIPNGSSYPGKGEDRILEYFGLHNQDYMLFAARFDPVKRLHLLLEAYKTIPPEKRIPLVVAGGQCKDSEYELLLRRLKSEGVFFIGHVKREILDPLTRKCTIFILPSVLEGMSNSLLSAMSAARCVICADIPENCDVVKHDPRVLFKKDDVTELSDKMIQYIGDVKIRNHIGTDMQKIVEADNNWNDTSIEYMMLIDRLLRKARTEEYV